MSKFSGVVKISNSLDDYIQPSQDCIQPLYQNEKSTNTISNKNIDSDDRNNNRIIIEDDKINNPYFNQIFVSIIYMCVTQYKLYLYYISKFYRKIQKKRQQK